MASVQVRVMLSPSRAITSGSPSGYGGSLREGQTLLNLNSSFLQFIKSKKNKNKTIECFFKFVLMGKKAERGNANLQIY